MCCAAHALAASRGFLVAEDVDLIREAVRLLPVGRHVTVVDLGAGSGTTALSVFAERAKAITVFTLDTSDVALASTEQCMSNAGYRPLWEGVLSESWVVEATGTSHPLVDLLLVDADHEYEAVLRDLTAWLPWVRPGAPVWCHDVTDLYPGCVQAVDEAVAAGLLAPLKTAGWGWLGLRCA